MIKFLDCHDLAEEIAKLVKEKTKNKFISIRVEEKNEFYVAVYNCNIELFTVLAFGKDFKIKSSYIINSMNKVYFYNSSTDLLPDLQTLYNNLTSLPDEAINGYPELN